MPAALYFKVTQTREVNVVANNMTDAVRIAEAAFENGQDTSRHVHGRPSDIEFGDTVSEIKEVKVEAVAT